MALSYKTRKRLALLILLIGLPIYIIVAVNVVALIERWFGRPALLIELGVFIGLGFLWALPFRGIFSGIGLPDPEADPNAYPHDPVPEDDKKAE